ncbi:FAD-dependent oxidoreductase [Streptomyces violascens]|uniref:FAD-dependent oxidoreductase n=1 Tax=Streptomyces violascens TaxID=67381 RepID=UPI001674A6AE|nr:hypothetical protein [Streptomyces violascens]GGU38118.1 FAD-binding monooxygenase [Streptomyces violascens]
MRRAIVLGGSFAGLMAARVLSDLAVEVVIVEPDPLEPDSLGRGAPHRGQLHALLAMGHTQLERWFPGITDELTAAGARTGSGSAVQFYVDGVLKAPIPDSVMLGATRPLLERHVRSRVLGLPNVHQVRGRARGLTLLGRRVAGVRYTASADDDGVLEESVAADLVVDAMGKASRLVSWLSDDGWGVVPVDRMRVDLGYATAAFRRGTEMPDLVIAHSSPGPSSGYQPTLSEAGALAAVEGDRWSVVLSGYADHAPSRDPEEFLARMRRCVSPLQQIAEIGAFDGPVEPFRFRQSQRRNYLRLPQFPGGLVVVGDALASVNPIYGQGLTLAMLQASSLHAYLRTGVSPHVPARGYFQRAAAVVNAAWQLSTTADLAQPHVSGPYPPGYAMTRWVGDRVIEASVRDSAVNRVFMDVLHMRARPQALSRPRVLLRTAQVLFRP